MTGERQRYALQTIFSFFLGLMVVAFVGVGVNTFYRSPQDRYQTQMQEFSRQEEDLGIKGPETKLSEADQAKLKEVRRESRALQDKMQAEMKIWTRNTSIILIVFATVVMALSLIRAEQLLVMSNGLLLGGLFTMLYGTGWTIASGDSKARFFVMTFALAVTIALGYVKFVTARRQPPKAVAAEGVAPLAIDVSGLESRVAMLEERAAAAAAALGGAGHDEREAAD